MTGNFNFGMAAIAAGMLAITVSLSVPAQAQHPKQDHPAPQRQSNPRGEVPRPPRQDRAFRNTQRPTATWQPQRQQPRYTRPGGSSAYSRRVYTRPSAPSSAYAQERPVPYPPSQIERRPQAPNSSYQGPPRREVPRPPAPGQSRQPAFAQEQRREP